MSSEQIVVPLGEIQISKGDQAVLAIPNLGAGVALIAYDRSTKVGGIAHILLPDNSTAGIQPSEGSPPAKFASEAVPLFTEQLLELGANKLSTSFKMAGGAQLFNFGGGGGNPLNVGSRTAIAVRAGLSRLGFIIEKSEIGGNKGRQLTMNLSTGEVFVRQIGGSESKL